MKAFSEVFSAGYPHTITTDTGEVVRINPRRNIMATLSGVGTIEVHPWGRGLHNLLADHASGKAPLDEVEFWMDTTEADPARVVIWFDHRGDWGMSPTIREGLTPEERAAIKSVLRAIYAQARGED